MPLPTPQTQIERELAQYELDLFWILDNYEALQEDYGNQFVAVLNGRVIGHAATIEQLTNELSSKYPDDFHCVVFEFIYEEHPNFVLGI